MYLCLVNSGKCSYLQMYSHVISFVLLVIWLPIFRCRFFIKQLETLLIPVRVEDNQVLVKSFFPYEYVYHFGF